MGKAFDVSILDKIVNTAHTASNSPVDAQKIVARHETPIAPQTAPQPTTAALNAMREISQGIKAGDAPYPLLLKSVRLISILTGEKAFYNACKDVIQGEGYLEDIPAEWQKEAHETNLARLEAARAVIDTAIEKRKKP